jgi:hypothetical protein
MSAEQTPSSPEQDPQTLSDVEPELSTLVPPELLGIRTERDGAAKLCRELPQAYSPRETREDKDKRRAWELFGLYFLHRGRLHEGIDIFAALYDHLILAQDEVDEWHPKGMPLVWMSEAYLRLGMPVLAKRYLMLTIFEDALRDEGEISPETSGAYFRAVWQHGLPDGEVRRYAKEAWDLFQLDPLHARYPEWLMQEVDQQWMTAFPTTRETIIYRANLRYMQLLLTEMGDGSGRSLERLAAYVLECMPGCRPRFRMRTPSTDYDVVSALDGTYADFRSEIGRYVLCECKDWKTPADFTTMAKFCRVLESAKSSFGILFSKKGITGESRTTDAAREQFKIFHEKGIVIVALDESDLARIARGASAVTILREKYERRRFDLS